MPREWLRSRLRAQEQLAAYGMADLRFSPDESELFLSTHVGEIDSRDARTIHELSDGWAAGRGRAVAVLHPQLDLVLQFYDERLLEAARQTREFVTGRAPVARKPAPADGHGLSERELQVPELVAQATPNKKIARALGSRRTR